MNRVLVALACVGVSTAWADDECHDETQLVGDPVSQPKIAAGGGRVFAAWRPHDSDQPRATFLDANAMPTGETRDWVEWDFQPASFIGYADGFLAFGRRGPQDDVAWKLGLDGTPVGEPTLLAGQNPAKLEGVFDGGAFVLAWMTDDLGGNGHAHMVRLTPDGVLGAAVELGRGETQPKPDAGPHRLLVASGGEITWVVWLVHGAGEKPHYVGKRIAKDGTVLDADAIAVFDGRWPALMSEGGAVRLVGITNDDALATLTLADDGTVSEPQVWVEKPLPTAVLAVAPMANGYRVITAQLKDAGDPLSALGELGEWMYAADGTQLGGRVLVRGDDPQVAVSGQSVVAVAATFTETPKGATSQIVSAVPNAYGTMTVLDEATQTKHTDEVCGCSAGNGGSWALSLLALALLGARRARSR